MLPLIALLCLAEPPNSETFLVPRDLAPPSGIVIRPNNSGYEVDRVRVTSLKNPFLQAAADATTRAPGVDFLPAVAPPKSFRLDTNKLTSLMIRQVGEPFENLIPISSDPTYGYSGFFQTAREFSVNGYVLGTKLSIFNQFQSTVIYQKVRGEWAVVDGVRVFFGYGVQLKFRISSNPTFLNQPKWFVSCTPRSKVEKQDRLRPFLAVQVYGVGKEEEPFEIEATKELAQSNPRLDVWAKGYRDRDIDKVLQASLKLADRVFDFYFKDGSQYVEPILITFPKKIAESYVSNSVRPNR
ncbi:MAG: hypothetical protein JST35_12445 [Armatimonadetes bacterium]|nr:hypothetical protein [Armatimonadota bacterium]